MNVSIRQIHPVFVGEVSGIDIARPLSRDEVAAVEAGMDRYAVLLFRVQKVTDEQQMAFSLNFGVLEERGAGTSPSEVYREPPEPETAYGWVYGSVEILRPPASVTPLGAPGSLIPSPTYSPDSARDAGG